MRPAMCTYATHMLGMRDHILDAVHAAERMPEHVPAVDAEPLADALDIGDEVVERE